MTKYTQAHWGKDEDEILSSSVVDGIELQALEVKLPRRSPAAISRRALLADYGTKVVDGIKILYKDVKRRNRGSKAIKTTTFSMDKIDEEKVVVDETPITATTVKSPSQDNCAEIVQKQSLIRDDTDEKPRGSVLHANSLAIAILTKYEIVLSVDSIYELSNQILNSHKDAS